MWESEGNSPRFELFPTSDGYPAGWLRIRSRIEDQGQAIVQPTLYFETDTGIQRSGYIKLPRPRNGKIDYIICLPIGISHLSIAPAAAPGTFKYQGLVLKKLSKYKAFILIAYQISKNVLSHPGQVRRFGSKIIRVIAKNGIRDSVHHILQFYRRTENANSSDYQVSAGINLKSDDRIQIASRIHQLKYQPLISIILPVYNPSAELLSVAINSVTNQLYENWQLCIADDASTNEAVRIQLETYQAKDERIKVIFRETNGHISDASNSALSLATGEFYTFLDQDDCLAEHALYLVVEELNQHHHTDIIYSDEDKIDLNGIRSKPFFKPEWNRDLFLSVNYLNHLTVIRAEVVRATQGFRIGYEGSQDYDLLLRCLKYTDDHRIRHIPYVLYHWRMVKGSTALSPIEKQYASESGRKALTDYFDTHSVQASIEPGMVPTTYRVRHTMPNPPPRVTIVIPTKDAIKHLQRCITSVKEKTLYPNYEIIVIDNQSVEEKTKKYFKYLEDLNIAQVIPYSEEFNYSAINNYAVRKSNSDIVCLLNNDVTVITPDWLGEMVAHAIRPDIGAVGAKLLYPNGLIQHAGIVLGIGGVAGHPHKYWHGTEHGYFMRLSTIQNVSAVTGACLVVRRTVYEAVGGLDEQNLAVAFNDVDFCLRIRSAGFRNLWTPYARLYHHESATRGTERDAVSQERFAKEVEFMKATWGAQLSNDPYYSPRLSLDSEDFTIAYPPRVVLPWETEYSSIYQKHGRLN